MAEFVNTALTGTEKQKHTSKKMKKEMLSDKDNIRMFPIHFLQIQ